MSLGQFAFAAVGAYVVAVWHGPLVLRFVAAAVVGAAVATLVGLPALRLKGLYLAVSTLAFAVSVNAVLISRTYLGRHLPSKLERPSVFGLDLDDERTLYYVALVGLAAVVVAVRGLRSSRFGRALLAARDNEQAVQSFGVSVVRLRLTAFAVSGALAALAGALYAFHQGAVTTDGFNANQSITMFTMAVVGGLSAVSGPIIGAAYQGMLLVFGASPLLQAVLLGLGGLGLLLLAPGGLVEVVFGFRDAVLRRIAKRHRLIVPSLIADQRADQAQRPALAPPRQQARRAAVYRLVNQWALPAEPHEQTGTAEVFAGVRAQDGDGGDDVDA